MKREIRYGFGKDYLSNWGIQQALREIYQNFLDYGLYEEEVIENNDHIVTVCLQNKWNPISLDFLRIGNSMKNNENAIGKHGEGLKMAFLILKRRGFKSKIITQKYIVTPTFYKDREIGDCFSFRYTNNIENSNYFNIVFECPKQEFLDFKDNLITSEDIIFSNYCGDIVDKEPGNIYSGGLFVIKCDNMSKAYNIKPKFLPLDRDRSVPHSFDVNYYSSQINAEHGKLTIKDLSYSDTLYINHLPQEVKQQIEPKIIGNSIEFTFKDDEGQDQVIANNSIKESLKTDSFFSLAIQKLRIFIAKQLGLYDLLLAFQEKHVNTLEAKADFELILQRVKQ